MNVWGYFNKEMPEETLHVLAKLQDALFGALDDRLDVIQKNEKIREAYGYGTIALRNAKKSKKIVV